MSYYEEHSFNILSTVLDSAYEGIVVVDQEAVIIHFNDAYSRFTGIKKEFALGRHVTQIIDNTRLHEVLKTGVAERGSIQIINGQEMIVHRIPIFKEGKVVAAIGMLIFEGVSELYKILEKHQEKLRKKPSLKQQQKPVMTLERIIGTSKALSDTKSIARRAAKTLATVLITGESGTGKELFAQSIHHLSPFSDGPFISVNCAAIPEHLFEAELFGYEEGAFSGAKKGGKPGKFEAAHEGTIFLDEIGDMPIGMQTKMLRALQEREAVRVGAIEPYRTNARVIAATNRSLEQMVREGTFREDLYYRLNIIRLHIPPLRERKEDIPLLLSYYIKDICTKYDIPLKRLTNETIAALLSYEWPGNIREVVNTAETLVSLVEKDEIEVADLQLLAIRYNQDIPVTQQLLSAPKLTLETVKQEGLLYERETILRALQETQGNKSKAAKKLGIHRSTLYDKLKKLNLS